MRKRSCALVCALMLGLAVAVAGGLPGPPDAASAARARGTWYHVRPGVTFNTAWGSNRSRYAINNKIKAAIDHAHRGSTIRIMSWNVMSRAATDHLLRAQRRGVRVLLLMDASNRSADVPNPEFTRLQRGLASGNHGRKRLRRSAARVCHGACRGTTGMAHSKFYLFSKTGASPYVTMEGSANLTLAAATNQWNDIYTWVGNRTIYNFSVRIFNQMWRDRPVRAPWQQVRSGPFTLAFSPESGRAYRGDPVTRILSQVKCAGAVHGNSSHHTIIRLFPDVMRGSRGLRNARQIRDLWNRGCDVEVGYTVLSRPAHAVLASGGGRGHVPLKHMATDTNHDLDFDDYFHLKVLTVNGVIGHNRAAYKMVNGSSNLSGLSAVSDENIGVFTVPRLVLRYQRFTTRWFHRRFPSAPYEGSGDAARMNVNGPPAPGAPVLRTPTGAPAIAPDGYIAPGTRIVNPETGEVVDPYRNIDTD